MTKSMVRAQRWRKFVTPFGVAARAIDVPETRYAALWSKDARVECVVSPQSMLHLGFLALELELGWEGWYGIDLDLDLSYTLTCRPGRLALDQEYRDITQTMSYAWAVR